MRFSKICVLATLVLVLSSGPSVVATHAAPDARLSPRQTLQTQIGELTAYLKFLQKQHPERTATIHSLHGYLVGLQKQLKELPVPPNRSQDVISQSSVVLL